ncbi:c-type cytochrome biogenesis protein CcmI [uncultured Marinobacter sp.]|uniref:c-type cytochrome biogenesis protein CcmI n=1 Tax=uncultured Marinobacter sp. TaxID=187379 RepID=UPI0030DAF749
MITTFWIPVAILILMALAFIVYPLLFSRPERRADQEQRNQNLLAYRTRLAELDAEHEQGILDQENYRQLKDELAGAMLDDVGTQAAPSAGSAEELVVDRRHRSTWVVVGISVVAIPLASVVLYGEWGAIKRVEQFQAMQQIEASGDDRALQMEDLTRQLHDRLQAEPDNPDGWAMLGRSYMRMERYPDAAGAFERLASVAPDERSRAVAWGLSAQAWFFNSEGSMDERVTSAIGKARELNENEVNSLGLLGIHAFERSNFEEAIRYWEKIIEVAPDHPQLPSIRRGVAQAYENLGMPVPEEPEAAPVSDRGVSVLVELDDAFAGQVSPDTTLFIYARTPDLQSAPLAVARMRADQLPVTIRLDDRLAMAPELRISGVEEVILAARLSISGTATPQPGDFQGIIEEPVPVSSEALDPVVLTIDQQMR